MRKGLIEELRATNVPMCVEAAAELEAVQARLEAGAALKSMLDDGDTPVGKKELAGALEAFWGASTSAIRRTDKADHYDVVNAIASGLYAVADELKR